MLEEEGLSKESIERISNEDLPFLLNWNLQEANKEAIESVNAIIAFSFGYGPQRKDVEFGNQHPYHPKLHKPGETNISIAKKVRDFNLPVKAIFAQWEVAEALKDSHGIIIPDTNVARPDKQYLGTSGVIQKFLENGLSSDDYTHVAIVAHRHHTYRCWKITEKTFRVQQVQKSLVIPENPTNYDSESLQPWTRSLNDWIDYEVGNRFHNRYEGNL